MTTRPGIRARAALLAAVIASMLAGCSTYEATGYAPQLAEVRTTLRDDPDGGGVRSLATVVGVRRADASAGLPRSVEARLRVENRSTSVVVVDPARLRLVARDLTPLPVPRTEPPTPQRLAAGESTAITAWFPAADRRLSDLASVSVEWVLEIGGLQRIQSATFERRYTVYRPYPYWGYPYYGYPSYGWRWGAWGPYGYCW